jgi:uncharacterized membrane protein
MDNMIVLSIVRFLHIFAMVAFFGASTTNVFILLPSIGKILEPSVAGKLMGEVMKRFRVVAYISIGVLLLTGSALLKTNEEYMGFMQFVNFWSVIAFVKHIFIAILIVLVIYSFEVLGKKVASLAANGPSSELARFQKKQIILSYIVLVISIIILIMTGILTA